MFKSYHVCLSGVPEQYVIIVSTDRTAVALWQEKRLQSWKPSYYIPQNLFQRPNSREVVELFEGGQNLRPNLPNPITLFPDNSTSALWGLKKKKKC